MVLLYMNLLMKLNKKNNKKGIKRLEQDKRERRGEGEEIDSRRIHIPVKSNLVKVDNWMALS
jgi:hypothetical protein